MAIAGIFLVDIRLGIMAWLATAAHEIPQELGDFGVLVHRGWSKGRAPAFNFLSALTFLLGGLVAYAGSFNFNVAFLIPFAAGNFLYIGASDLLPEVSKHGELKTNALNLIAFISGTDSSGSYKSPLTNRVNAIKKSKKERCNGIVYCRRLCKRSVPAGIMPETSK